MLPLRKLKYTLSFWFVGRNPYNDNIFSSTTYLRVFINTTQIYEVTNISTTAWTKTTINFSVTWDEATRLTFKNTTQPDRDSSFLITGLVMTVA